MWKWYESCRRQLDAIASKYAAMLISLCVIHFFFDAWYRNDAAGVIPGVIMIVVIFKEIRQLLRDARSWREDEGWKDGSVK